MTNINPIQIVLLIFYAGVLPLIFSGYNEGRAFSDQITFNYPVILHFTDSFDVTDYSSTSIPGYHLILAGINKWVFSSEMGLKLVNSFFTAFILLFLSKKLGQRFTLFKTVALCLPIITSIYIFPGGVWLISDNLSWFTVLLVVSFIIKTPLDYHSFWVCSGLLLISVFVRQTNIWLSLPIFVSLGINSFEQLAKEKVSHSMHYFRAFLVLLPAVVILLVFFSIWEGTVPPRYQNLYQAPNPVVPSFFLAVFFFSAFFYTPFVYNPIKKLMTDKSSLAIIGIAFFCGFILSIIFETTWSEEEGRVSGIWNLVKITPVFEKRSILLTVMSSFGASLLAIWLLLLTSKTRWVMASAIFGFIVIHTLGHFAYERYFTGFIFIFILLSLPEILKNNKLTHSVWQIIAPCTLAVINLIVLIRGLI